MWIGLLCATASCGSEPDPKDAQSSNASVPLVQVLGMKWNPARESYEITIEIAADDVELHAYQTSADDPLVAHEPHVAGRKRPTKGEVFLWATVQADRHPNTHMKEAIPVCFPCPGEWVVRLWIRELPRSGESSGDDEFREAWTQRITVE